MPDVQTKEPKVIPVCDWCDEEITGRPTFDYGLPYHRDCYERKQDVQAKNEEPYDEDEL